MPIYWQHYYDTLWQALATIIIHGLCSIILFVILSMTIYRFFMKCKCNTMNMNMCNNYNKANRKQTKSTMVDDHDSIPRIELQASNSMSDGRTSTIDGGPRASASGSYMQTGSYSRKSTFRRSSDEYRRKSIDIATSIKVLTLFYVLLIFLFSFTSFIMRVLMVFYDYKIDCIIREHSIEIALLGRICLFIIFSYRLYFSFKESSFAYPTRYLIIFTLIGFIITNSTMIYFFISVTQNRNHESIDAGYNCTKPGFSTTKAILPYFLCEFTFNAILVFLFCRKLVKSLRLLLQLSGGGVQMNFQVLQTIQLMSKMTLLMGVIFMSTILILSLMTSYLSSACISLDNMVNVICMLLVFKHNEKYYNSFCCLCNKMCVRFCSCFCLNGIRIHSDHHYNHNHPNNNDTKLKISSTMNDEYNDNKEEMIMQRKVRLDVITESTEEHTNHSNSKESSPENPSCSDEYNTPNDSNQDNDMCQQNDGLYEYSTPISPNESSIYVDTLAVIFLNENNSNSKFDEAPVPMFVD